MPLPEGVLNPIPGDNPSGKNLRYDPVYDKIREARREEEAGPLGDLHDVKKADYPQVIKLANDVLANKSKDLQIAAWLTEAMLIREHVAGLREALDLLKGMLEQFWDSVYPEIEDDDVEIRAAPLGWVGSKLGLTVRRLPVTKSKLDLLKYQESRQVGYEKDVEGNETKTAARNSAINDDKKCSAEEFDDAVKATGDAYYEKLSANVSAALASLEALGTLCDEKFGRDAPNFANLRTALEEIQDMVRFYYKPAVEESDAPAEEVVEEAQEESTTAAAGGATPAKKRGAVTAEPVDRDDAMQRVSAVAGFLRRECPQNPVPYLLLRAARWGELRGAGPSLDLSALDAPPTEKRTHIKKMAMEGNWAEVLEGAEDAMGLPCGRGWLDLQRYAVRACESLGYDSVAASIRADLRALLSDYPDLVNASLMDDTPAANAETQAWLKESILPPLPEPPPAAAAPEPEPEPVPVAVQASTGNGEKGPDVVQLAMKAARAGKVQEAIGMLTQDIGNERTGRGRFQKHIQLANIFLATKHEAIAYPILAELAEEIDRRRLEEWEDPSLVAQPLALLYRCSEKLGRNDAEKEKIYQKLCRLDPAQALALR